MLLVKFLPTTIISKGKTYDFKCIKIKNIFIIADSAYQGIQNIHNNSIIPEKKVMNLQRNRKNNNKLISFK